jgi:hypothetical protein
MTWIAMSLGDALRRAVVVAKFCLVAVEDFVESNGCLVLIDIR